MLKKIIPTHRLQIINLDNENVKTRFKTFFSKNNIQTIADNIKKDYVDIVGINYKIIITNKFTNEKIIVKIKSNLTTTELRDDLINYFVDNLNVVDIRNTRYELKITNNKSSEIDVKNFCFNSDNDFQTIYDNCKLIFDEHAKNNDTIFFNNSEKEVTSHYVVLSYAGTTKRRKMKSKCMSIKLINYSSEEILNILRENYGK